MTPRRLLREFTAAELAEQEAFDRIEPMAGRRADVLAALLQSASLCAFGGKAPDLQKLVYDWGGLRAEREEREAVEETVEERMERDRAAVRKAGGEVLD